MEYFCAACGVNQYRASNQSQTSCRSCPLNSEARVEGSVICQCLPGYYHNDNRQDGPAMSCTRKIIPHILNAAITST